MTHMKDILTDIIAHKQKEVEQLRQQAGLLNTLESLCAEATPAPGMRQALQQSATGIIAEFKRRSPSKGWINREAKVEDVLPAYQQAGASAASVLTDTDFFGGSLDDLRAARHACATLPLLRKDFIIDELQLLQARAAGASAVLLIAAALTRDRCRTLAAQAHRLQLEVLLEVHAENELDHIGPDTDMVGVNNRHLGTFHTDVETSLRLAGKLPAGVLHVSESGMSDPQTVRRLRQAGYRGFLIGGHFMEQPRPGEELQAFIRQLQEP